MLTIDLDDELSRHTGEIGEVGADRTLSPKFGTMTRR
jgi:hypothetical protein